METPALRRTVLAAALTLAATAAEAGPPRVVTDIRPVHSLTASIMGETGAPELLFDAAPDAPLTSAQRAAVDKADLVIWTGEALAPALAEALAADRAPAALALLDIPALPMRIEGRMAILADIRTGLPPQAGLDDLLTGDGDPHAGEPDGQGHGPLDPHIWLDPANAARLAEIIALQLAELDPANADNYRANAAATRARLAALTGETRAILAPARPIVIVPTAEATRYLLLRFDMQMGDLVTENDSDGAGGAPPCQLLEPGRPGAAAADVIRREVDLYGTGLAPGPTLYEGLIRAVAGSVARCARR